MTAVDGFVTASFAHILDIPHSMPVFKRERQNKMYSLSAFYLSGWLSTSITLLPYPIITGILTYFIYGFRDPSFNGVMTWFGINFLSTYAGASWGFA
mmetsp:Transcript_9303/g.6674  ORF Transcript_9303/g.6674 Transcript_9303/m.6674 type:complete len:97 (+) Transcript_9303:1427-1717(+)